MTIDNELIDILRIDCAGLTVQQSALKQAQHIDYIYMCIGVNISRFENRQNLNIVFDRMKAIDIRKTFIKQNPKYTETSIKDLNLKPRSYNCLKHYGIKTIAELLMCTKNDIMIIRNLSITSLNDIIEKLQKYDNLQLIDGDFTTHNHQRQYNYFMTQQYFNK
jgi:DNA-directed RNA polymerase alpha subunit